LGWSVIPCHQPLPDHECSCGVDDCNDRGKHPRVQWATYQQERATKDQIRAWWARWEDANIGIVTGRVSGIVVLDIDPAHGGEDSVEELEQRFGPFEDTITSLTGGGGRHLIYAHPGVDMRGGSNYLPGIDIRADGGLIIAPPSLHASGRSYVWEASSEAWDTTAAPMPRAMATLIAERPAVIGERVGGRPRFDIADMLGRAIPEGDRDETLIRIAGYYVAKTPGDSATPLARVLEVNKLQCKPPLPESQVHKVVNSALRREARKAQAHRELETRLKGKERAGELSNADRLDLAKAFWKSIGLPAIADWVLLRGNEPTYVLEMPNGEDVVLGPNILAWKTIDESVLNRAREELTPHTAKTWRPKAVMLRNLVREIDLEPVRAADRLTEWLDEFIKVRGLTVRPAIKDRADLLGQGVLRLGSGPGNGLLYLKPDELVRHLKIAGSNVEKGEVLRVLRGAGWKRTSIRTGDADNGFTTTRCWREGRPGDKADEDPADVDDVDDEGEE
jgi:hypothetical protein